MLKFKEEHWNLESDLNVISHSIDHNHVIKGSVVNLLQFQ